MLKLQPSKQLRGMILSGDFNDLEELVDAAYVICDSEYNEALGFDSLSNMLLSLAYDARHASMGDRDIGMVNNGSVGWNVDLDDRKKTKSISKENIYYSVPITMLTCVFTGLMIDTLNKNCIQKMEMLKETGYPDVSKDYSECKNKKEEAILFEAKRREKLVQFHRETGMDAHESEQKDIAHSLMEVRYAAVVLQKFSSCVWKALEEILGVEEVSSLYDEYLLKVVKESPYYKDFYTQFVSRMDITYLNLKTKKERIKYLPAMISDIINLGEEYEVFFEILSAEAKKQHCKASDLQYKYPEFKNW